ncbi:MAG: hypothetical protein R3C56_32280 [Pirellulaceae bacterium]
MAGFSIGIAEAADDFFKDFSTGSLVSIYFVVQVLWEYRKAVISPIIDIGHMARMPLTSLRSQIASSADRTCSSPSSLEGIRERRSPDRFALRRPADDW